MYKENHEERAKVEENNEKEMALSRYWKTHDYDPVFGKFYDAEKE